MQAIVPNRYIKACRTAGNHSGNCHYEDLNNIYLVAAFPFTGLCRVESVDFIKS
jgi:hypothetical protein